MSRGKIIGFALLFLLAAVGLLWPLASSLSSSGATSTSDSVSVTQYTGDFNVAADGNMSANEALNALFQVVVTGSSGSLIPPIPAIRRSAGAHKSPPSQGTGHLGKTQGVRQMEGLVVRLRGGVPARRLRIDRRLLCDRVRLGS